MSTFKVPLVKIEDTPIPHPNADRLDLVKVMGYQCVVAKDSFKKDDLAAYIPEAALVPDKILEDLELMGKLAGKEKNRVKAIKLRGILSQGILYKASPNWDAMVGEDLQDFLEIKKYTPPIPVNFAGQVDNNFGQTLKFEVENIKNYPHIFQERESVNVTEKMHGTWCCLGLDEKLGPLVSSKGLSAKGLTFKINEENADNLYVRMWHRYSQHIAALREYNDCSRIYVLGEIVGKGVQDLEYGFEEPDFRVFDIYTGTPQEGQFLEFSDVMEDLENLYFDLGPDLGYLWSVPIVAEFVDFEREELEKWTSGSTLVPTNGDKPPHLREGVVIRPTKERTNEEIGRVILKSVSEDYLLRKGGTEYE